MSVGASNAGWLAPGCHLDRYDLLLQIGEGGMGTLWLARQEGKHGFDKIVAIKTILPKLASDAQFRRMFLDEARVVSRIEHPNVAQVLDLGEEDGVLFMVMEWIDGESLGTVGRAIAGATDTLIPVGILTRIMIDVCAGLHAAHELTDDDGLPLGVVHRDVSPHNLLVGFRGKTKVIDFGVAKARNRVAQDTSVGLLKGKIAYMAPEQAMGNAVDRRTDVWSAGASMYRLLAGHVPYNAPDELAVLRQLIEGLAPSPLSPSVPEPIRGVVEKAIEPDATKRFDTAQEMGSALEAAMRAMDIHASREDVAAFMEEHLGESRAKRAREIDGATRESRARMRVERVHTEMASAPAIEVALDPPPRPSMRPTTANNVLVGSARPSRRPTAAGPGAEAYSRLDLAAAGTENFPPSVSAPIVLVLAPLDARRLASRPFGLWITGGCFAAILLAGAFAWRAVRPARSAVAAAASASSPIRPPASVQAPALSPAGPPPTQATTVPTPDLLALVPAPARPNDQSASTTRTVVVPALDRGSAADLLERARQARRAGRIGDAAALFAAAVEKAPTNSEALTGLAEVDEAQGVTAKAIVTYRRAVAANPKYLPARLGLGDALWTSGQRDEARTTYRSIVDEFPASMYPELVRIRAAGNATNQKAPK